MITIYVYGIDGYAVRQYSEDSTTALASLFETVEDDISFCVPESRIIHAGIDQIVWNTVVIVRAPSRFAPLEEKVADYILKTITLFSVNPSVEFEYFDEGHRYQRISEEYDRFVTDANIGEAHTGEWEDEEEGEDHECHCDEHDGHCEDGECECEDGECKCGHHHHHHEDEEGEEIYTGNAFEGFEEKWDALHKEGK